MYCRSVGAQRQREVRDEMKGIESTVLKDCTLFYLSNFLFIMFIEFFSGSGSLADFIAAHNIQVSSTDRHSLRGCRAHDYICDFLDFDYKSIPGSQVRFLYFGFPCTTFSKASGGYHFSKVWEPLTPAAHNVILLLNRMFEIINYFSGAVWYIENPAGRFVSHPLVKKFIDTQGAHIYRFDMCIFKFPTKKQTDLITNSPILFLTNPVHRVNGKYQKVKFDNLTLKQRQQYTTEYCNFIYENIFHLLFAINPPRSVVSL